MELTGIAVWGPTSLIRHCLVLGAEDASKGGGSVGFVLCLWAHTVFLGIIGREHQIPGVLVWPTSSAT
jgi:hypothetical protein